MPADPDHPLARAIRRTAASLEYDDLSDRDLLTRYAKQADDAAFLVLLRRHGGLVWRVCRAALGDTPAAEDAFQATFLVLVRRAGSIRHPATLGAWLFGVARRVTRRAKNLQITRPVLQVRE